jgi:P27 family predicted phage terminase small subunit
MGSRGPAKKPAQSHKKNGTYRADRHGGVGLRAELPMAPADMSPQASAHWAVIGRELSDAGLISGIDRTAFRMLCESMAIYLEAMDEIREKGMIAYTDKGFPIQHPAIGIRNTAWTQIVAACKQFGMTPSSRTGLHLETKQEDDDINGILGLRVVS